MKRATLGAILGLFVGGVVGCLLAYGIQRLTVSSSQGGWTDYPTLANPKGEPVVAQVVTEGNYFFGLLVGMGFGAVTGAVIGAAGAIVQAVREGPAPARAQLPAAVGAKEIRP